MMMQQLRWLPIVSLMFLLGCSEPTGSGPSDRNDGMVPVSDILGDDESDTQMASVEQGYVSAENGADEPSTAPSNGSVRPDAEEASTTSEQTEPRSIQVTTWHPPDVPTPEWIQLGVRAVQGNRRMFAHYQGDYRRYTTDLIREIRQRHPDGRPVVLILQHWLNRAHFQENDPSTIDRFGLFTHVDDRTSAGLPGIWPKAGIEFWYQANDHLFRRLKEAGIEVDFVALDTELTPHGRVGVYSVDGTFEAMLADPRWHNEPLLGFGGKTAADLIPNATDRGFQELWRAVRTIGQHIFATATNMTITDRLLEYYPDALISDYNMFSRVGTLNTASRRAQRESLQVILNALGTDQLKIDGVGNTASPSYYGNPWWRDPASESEETCILEAMLTHARGLVENYGPDHIAPWIISRGRLNRNLGSEIITESMYREWLKDMVDLGIRRFIWFPGGRGDSIEEQLETIRSLEYARHPVD